MAARREAARVRVDHPSFGSATFERCTVSFEVAGRVEIVLAEPTPYPTRSVGGVVTPAGPPATHLSFPHDAVVIVWE